MISRADETRRKIFPGGARELRRKAQSPCVHGAPEERKPDLDANFGLHVLTGPETTSLASAVDGSTFGKSREQVVTGRRDPLAQLDVHAHCPKSTFL
jgi:hypothetical protein